MPNVSANLDCSQCQRLQQAYGEALRQWGTLQAEYRLSGIAHTKRARHNVEEAQARMNAAAEALEQHQSSCVACQPKTGTAGTD
jgi:plasmid maintenance system antidote protein VapI